MNKQYIEDIFIRCLEKEYKPFNIPSESDWTELEKKFECTFSKIFHDYTELISKYILPGSLNVATENNNGDDTISIVYDNEMNYGSWDKNFIPFFQIGNGDYFCFNSYECPDSLIYYYSHEEESFNKYLESFEVWISDFEKFYCGE